MTNVSTIDETVQGAKREKRAALLFRSKISLDNIPSLSTASGEKGPKRSISGDGSINSTLISEDNANTSRRSTRSSQAGKLSLDNISSASTASGEEGLNSFISGDRSMNSTLISDDNANTSRRRTRSFQAKLSISSSSVYENPKNTSTREPIPPEQEKTDIVSEAEENINSSRKKPRRSNNLSKEKTTNQVSDDKDKSNVEESTQTKKIPDLVNSLDQSDYGNATNVSKTNRRSSVTSGILKPPSRRSSLRSVNVGSIPGNISEPSRSISYNGSGDFNSTSGSAYMTHSQHVCETISVNSSDPSSNNSNCNNGVASQIQTTRSVHTAINSDMSSNSTTQQVKRRKKRNLLSTSTLMENLTQDTLNTSVKSKDITFSARKTDLTQRTNRLLNDLSVKSGKERVLDFSTNSGTMAPSDNSKLETFKQPLLPRRFSKVSLNDSHAQSSSSADGISLETPHLPDSEDLSVLTSSQFFKHINKNSTKISQFGTSTVKKAKPTNQASDVTSSGFERSTSTYANGTSSRSSKTSFSNIDVSSIGRDKTRSSTKSKSSLSEASFRRSVNVSVEAAETQRTRRRSSVGLGYQTMDYADLSRDTHPEDSILRKIFYTHDISTISESQLVLAPTTSQNKARCPRRKPNDNVLEIVLDNGEIYKPKKMFKEKNAPWINNRLYKYLKSKLEAKYKLKTRLVSEYFVKLLYEKSNEIYRNGDELYGHTLENKNYLPPPYGRCACAVLSTRCLYDKLEYVESDEEEE
ncbi:hypothetical protein WDU94_004464 [Cyamophila willieti]